MRQPLRDYGYKLSKVPLLYDNESAILMANNPVEHSRTKHIDIRYNFLRDHQPLLEICLFKTYILRQISVHFIEAFFIIW
jgi:hypothetical protein